MLALLVKGELKLWSAYIKDLNLNIQIIYACIPFMCHAQLHLIYIIPKVKKTNLLITQPTSIDEKKSIQHKLLDD